MAKPCPSCSPDKALPIAAFGYNSNTPDGRSTYCKSCQNEKQRAWKKANVEKIRAWKREYMRKVRQKNAKGRKPKGKAQRTDASAAFMANLPE